MCEPWGLASWTETADLTYGTGRLGPIIRVNPEELSIHDPEAYNEIYVTESKRRTDNHQPFSQGIGFDSECEP